MALLGNAALAMWWEVDAPMRLEFENWHTHEHFAERLGVPGFHRRSRWRRARAVCAVLLCDAAGHALRVCIEVMFPWRHVLRAHRCLSRIGGGTEGSD